MGQYTDILDGGKYSKILKSSGGKYSKLLQRDIPGSPPVKTNDPQNADYYLQRPNLTEAQKDSAYTSTKTSLVNPGEVIVMPEQVISSTKSSTPLKDIPLTESQRRVGRNTPLPPSLGSPESEEGIRAQRLNDILGVVQSFTTKPLQNVISPIAEGERQIGKGASQIFGGENLLRGTGNVLAGTVKTGLGALPPIMALNIAQPTITASARKIGEEIGVSPDTAENIANKITPFVFGLPVGIGSLTSETVTGLLDKSGAFNGLDKEDKSLALDLIHNGLFFGIAGFGKKPIEKGKEIIKDKFKEKQDAGSKQGTTEVNGDSGTRAREIIQEEQRTPEDVEGRTPQVRINETQGLTERVLEGTQEPNKIGNEGEVAKGSEEIKPQYFTKEEAPTNIKENFKPSSRDFKEVPGAKESVPKELYKTLEDGTKVYLVDGTYIRDNVDVEFTLGGHEYVYPRYIPKGEVWLDRDINKIELDNTLRHELTERQKMIGGEKYDTAHEKANKEEIAIRQGTGNESAIQRMLSENKSPEDISKALKVPIEEVNKLIKPEIKPVEEPIVQETPESLTKPEVKLNEPFRPKIKPPKGSNAAIVNFVDGKQSKLPVNDIDVIGTDFSKIKDISFGRVELNKSGGLKWETFKEDRMGKPNDFLKAPKIPKRQGVIPSDVYEQSSGKIKSGDSEQQDLINVGTYHLEKIVSQAETPKRDINNFTLWSKEMKNEFGSEIEPQLSKIWQGVKESFGEQLLKIAENNPLYKSTINLDAIGLKPDRTPEPIETPKGLDLPSETVLQSFQRKIQDKLNRSGQVIELGKKLKDISDDINYRQKAEIWARKASGEIQDFESNIINGKDGLLDKLANDKIDINELGEYLYAKHAPERNAHVEKLTPENTKGSGITNEEASQILSKYGSKKMDAFANEFYNTVTKPALQMKFDSGLIDQKTFDQLNDYYKDYVPLKGTSKPQKFRALGKGFSVTNKGIFGAKGRNSIANNPIVQAVMDYEDTIILAEKNKVGQSLLGFIEQFPDAKNETGQKLWEVKSQQFIPSYDKFGEIDYMNKRYKLQDNELSVWVKGKQKIVTINDEALVRGLKNLGQERGLALLNNANNYLRTINTLMNPEFMLTNFERDLQESLINLQGENVKGLTGEIIKDVPKAIKEIYKVERGKDTGWRSLYQEFERAGGKTGWLEQKPFEQKMKEFENKIKYYHKNGLIKNSLKETVKFIEDLNEAVENGIRFSTYKNAIERGISKDQAANLAANLTINFNKKGEWGQLINSLYLFSNAGIQGTARLMRSLKSPKVQALVGGIVGMSTLSNYMNRMINKEEYDKIPTYVKDSNWIQMLPNGSYIKIRMPYGYNIFGVMGNVAGDAIWGETTFGESVGRITNSVVDAFNPLGMAGSVSQMLAPTVVRPIVQLSENKNFAGQPIRKEQPPYSPKVPESSLYFKTVNPGTQKLTEWLNEKTGGNYTIDREGGRKAVTSGMIDINPENIDHLIDFAGGGTGRFITNIFKSGYKMLNEGDFPPISNIPFARQVVGSKPENIELQKAYKLLEESGRTVYSEGQKKQFKDLLLEALKNGQIDTKQYNRLNTEFDNAQLKASGVERPKSEYKPLFKMPDINPSQDLYRKIHNATKISK